VLAFWRDFFVALTLLPVLGLLRPHLLHARRERLGYLLPGKLLPGAAGSPADFLWLGNAWAGWGVLFLLAAVPTVAGFGLYNVSLGYLPSSVANLVVTAEPAFTALFAYILLGERLNAVQISGSLLILAGVVFLRVAEGREKILPQRSPSSQRGKG